MITIELGQHHKKIHQSWIYNFPSDLEQKSCEIFYVPIDQYCKMFISHHHGLNH
jgi:hypothetical protein